MAIDIGNYRKTGKKAGRRKGEHHNLKLDDNAVLTIYNRVGKGEHLCDLAREYGVTVSLISKIINGHQRSDITGGSIYDREHND